MKAIAGLIIIGVGLSGLAGRAIAQVTPDGTLSTRVTQSGNRFTIDDGDRVGNNLFHSFSQFSVPTGGAASFNNAADVQNIFSRVTGGMVSNINGVIQTNGTANLFLLNPSGILFGPNAALNMGGSFIGTTANSVKFADGVEFSAVNPTATPLLTISVPTGLQFYARTGDIQVQGNGNDGIVPTSNLGIISSPGQTIALVGGNVRFTGGVITAPAGRIEVGAVESGLVSLTPTPAGWQLGYSQVQVLGDVNLINRSSLWNPDPVGNLAGGIQVVGRDITLNQSQIAAATAGAGQGGAITVNAQRSLILGGVTANAQAPSAWIVNQVAPGAMGNGGAVNIQTGNLSLQDGAGIETFSLGSGAAGKVQVRADTILADGTVLVNSPLFAGGSSSSHISSTVYGSGAGGDVDVAARQITLTESGQIATYVLPGATGQGGNIAVNASDITAIGFSPLSFTTSGIQTYTLGIGNGGAVNVSTDQLSLVDSGAIITFVTRIAGIPDTGIGNAGSITVVARDAIVIAGFSPNQPTQVSYVGSATAGAGNSGSVSVTASKLSIQAGGGLGTSSLPVVGAFGDRAQTNNLGNAGNVTLTIADQIEVSGSNPITKGASDVGTSTLGSGNGGNVMIKTRQLQVRDGAVINAFTGATGNAGTLTIQAEDILVEGKKFQNSSIVSNATILSQTTRQFYGLPDFPTGDTGTVSISTNRLTIRDQGTINVKHEGTGNAGQLNIQAKTVVLENGSIEASTAAGQGGNINLQVQDLLLLRQGSQLVATAGGDGNGGNITIAAPIIAGLENSDIIANAVKGRGGNIDITTQGIIGLAFRNTLTPRTDPTNDITASSEFSVNGNVQINNIGVDPNSGLGTLPANLTDSSNQIAQGCTSNHSNSFVVTGRGGLPTNPTEQVSSDRAWSDLRDLSAFQNTPPAIAQDALLPKKPLIEATNWTRNPNGTIELVAQTTNGNTNPGSAPETCAVANR